MSVTTDYQIIDQIEQEHRDLELHFEMVRRVFEQNEQQPHVIQSHLAELLALLKTHFASEEDGGYFVSAVEMAPHLAAIADALEREHEQLLKRLEGLGARLSIDTSEPIDIVSLRVEFVSFLDACAAHEHRENDLIQEAYLTDIGTGD